jgi:uncharacterized protein (DUF1697 family)
VIYVALLRGINVGGKNKIEMARLKTLFEGAGAKQVSTYINSGNVIFADPRRKPATITKVLEQAIESEFGLAIRLLLRDLAAMKQLVRAVPRNWTNDSNMRCDVLFLWEEYDSKEILTSLRWKPEIEDVVYVPGALIWRMDRVHVNRSGLGKVVGTDLYRGMTIRNVNTVRKITELMAEAGK